MPSPLNRALFRGLLRGFRQWDAHATAGRSLNASMRNGSCEVSMGDALVTHEDFCTEQRDKHGGTFNALRHAFAEAASTPDNLGQAFTMMRQTKELVESLDELQEAGIFDPKERPAFVRYKVGQVVHHR